MKMIFKYLSPYKWIAFGGLIIKITSTIMDLIIPYILSYIIDVVILKKSIPSVFTFGGLMIIASFIGFFSNVYANKIASHTSMLATKVLRKDVFRKIEELSESQKDEITLPSLISRMTTDTYNVHQMIGVMQRLGVRAPILLLGGIVVCAFLDPILTLVMVIILPLIMPL
jgi:ATP-binding cassette subfamily B protein